MLKVLVACEESQRVCSAFRRLGHKAYSCDVIEPSGGHPEWHVLGDVLEVLNPKDHLGDFEAPALYQIVYNAQMTINNLQNGYAN